ncbi:MAG: beta-galactosidase, partial [Planctomycetes bacterium]|nr:beta-galactosidase [Planctomycetota bacterium]
YTRTTGIWQTVWLEPVPAACRLERPRITPDVGGSRLIVEQPLVGDRRGLRVRAMLGDARGCAAMAECDAASDFIPRLVLEIPADRVRLWSPDDPHLYDLEIELLNADGATVDRATSYAGLRSVTIDGPAILINGRTIFQRLVLDQGYYPDGIMTAPSDEALWRDIELSLAVGFNGARLHQKVFEERFLYHADRMGYLVWGEFPDWGCRSDRDGRPWQEPDAAYVTQWLEALARDYSHPSIVGWCPLNETCQETTDEITTLDDVTRGMFLATRAMDATRPVIDASGYSHRVPEADVYDSHDYSQDVALFRARHDATSQGQLFVNTGKDGQPWSIPWRGQPVMVSEFGGTWWQPGAPPDESSWGYGQRPRTVDEFYERFEGLCGALLDNAALCGYCYTELTDVYQEQNGLYGFDRAAKFDVSRLRAIQQRPAAIERRTASGGHDNGPDREGKR